MKDLKAKCSVLADVYNTESPEGKKAIERLFGAEVVRPIVKMPPLGVWCLTTDKELVKPEDWSKEMNPQGVLLVVDGAAFVVALHASAVLQWGAMEQTNCDLVYDRESYDSKKATDAMIAAYKDSYYKSPSGELWDVYGTPAAEFARQYSYGNIGAGEWDVPTVRQLSDIQGNRDEINRCITAMGGFRLPAGYHWSSVAKDKTSALVVDVFDGDDDDLDKDFSYLVRAVSAFQF